MRVCDSEWEVNVVWTRRNTMGVLREVLVGVSPTRGPHERVSVHKAFLPKFSPQGTDV